MESILITGGAGFIGSHLADALCSQGHPISILDNLSSGKKENLSDKAQLVVGDILNPPESLPEAETVFHLAADPDVRSSAQNPLKSFENNAIGTYHMLEWCRKVDARHFVLASSSTVYGETSVQPTPEYCPTEPISNYGASKLACEAYVSSFSRTYGIKATILRYANIFGERSTHGVIYDFFMKLKRNPKRLEILGNGLQEKSYLYIRDALDATMAAWKKQPGQFGIFNIGSSSKVNVNEIADIICLELGVSPFLSYTGGERGWDGDVKSMLLDTTSIRNLGWEEKTSFEEGVRNYVSHLSSHSS